jgi:lipoate-protein ligase A
MKDQRRNGRWRLLRVGPRRGAENMARDVALMRRAKETGEIVFSIYEWARPTLSLGRNQRAKGCYNLESIRARGVDVVRRPTGGRALLHNREVTYSVTAPLADSEGLRESYDRINRILLEGLLSLGVGAAVAGGSSPALPPTDIPCFAEPSAGELISDNRKLVGSAQWRDSGALLQHGSILIEDDQSMIADFSIAPGESHGVPTPATLTGSLGYKPSVAEVAEAMFASVRYIEDRNAVVMDESEVADATRAELPFYENELWTWRR